MYIHSIKTNMYIISTKQRSIIISGKQSIKVTNNSVKTNMSMYLLLYNCNRSVMDFGVFPRALPLGVSNFCL